MYDMLTAQELEDLSVAIYHSAGKFFDRAGVILAELAAIGATWTDAYNDRAREYAVLQAAGVEQHQLHTELVRVMDQRHREGRAGGWDLSALDA
jgi:hypothetical protein